MDENETFISKNTSFNGTITARKVTVEGLVKGDVNASERVFIKKDGIVNGDIRTQKLLCEEGAQHAGMIQFRNELITEISKSESSAVEAMQSQEKPVDKSGEEQEIFSEKSKEEKNSKRLW